MAINLVFRDMCDRIPCIEKEKKKNKILGHVQQSHSLTSIDSIYKL